MNVLIDTHALIWLLLESKRLSRRAREAMSQARAEGSLVIADITLWEVAWLIEHQRITILVSPEQFLQEAVSVVVVEPVTPQIAAMAVRLPASFPRDPTDRMITSTALSLGLSLVTADERIRASRVVPTIW